MSRFCTNCGKEAQENESFCTGCGAKLGAPAQPAAQAPVYNQQYNTGYQQQPVKSSNGMAIAGFIVTLVSSIICCGAFNLIGLIFSIVGVVTAKNYPNNNGKGLAWAGIIINIVFVVLVVLLYVLLIALGVSGEINEVIEDAFDM